MRRRSLLIAAGAAAGIGAARAAETASADGEVVLGCTGILSGPLGLTVKDVLSGANLAFDAANGTGGIAGRKVRLVSLDDELKPEKAVANYQRLLGEMKVVALFGCVGSGTTAAAAPVIIQSGAPLIAGYAVADTAREKVRGSAYFVRATNARETSALVRHLTTLGITRIAMAYLDNPGGQEALRLVDAALAERQLKLHASSALKGDGSTTAAAAQSLAEKQPQAVIMYLGGTIPGELMKASWAIGSSPNFYGMSIVAGDLTAKVVGEKTRGLAISEVVPYPWSNSDALTQAYRRLAERAKVPVGYNSFEGFLNGQVVLEALRRAGRDLSRARLHAAMRALKVNLAGMELDFTTGAHTGSTFVDLVQVTREGRFMR